MGCHDQYLAKLPALALVFLCLFTRQRYFPIFVARISQNRRRLKTQRLSRTVVNWTYPSFISFTKPVIRRLRLFSEHVIIVSLYRLPFFI